MADTEQENTAALEELLLQSSEPGKMPSRKELLELLETSDISDDVKENIRMMIRGNMPQVFGSYGSGTLLAALFIVLIFCILLFFGYKLYKSIKDKELKREEKKKAKQMKKKK